MGDVSDQWEQMYFDIEDEDDFDFQEMCESAGTPASYTMNMEEGRPPRPRRKFVNDGVINHSGVKVREQVEVAARRMIQDMEDQQIEEALGLQPVDHWADPFRFIVGGSQQGKTKRMSQMAINKKVYARWLDERGEKNAEEKIGQAFGTSVYRDESRCGFVRREDGAFMSDRDLMQNGRDAQFKKPKQTRNNAMKTKTQLMNMAAMLADDIVTVKCRFSKTGQDYTYKASRDLAETLEKGDRCVVTKDDHVGFTCVAVWDVEDECLLDDENQTYQWLIAKVDQNEAERLQSFDEGASEQLRKAQRKAAKRSMLQALDESLEEGDIQGAFALPAPVTADTEATEEHG